MYQAGQIHLGFVIGIEFGIFYDLRGEYDGLDVPCYQLIAYSAVRGRAALIAVDFDIAVINGFRYGSGGNVLAFGKEVAVVDPSATMAL